MKSKEKKFIVTKDLDTAYLLKKTGFTLVNYNDGVFCFLNDEEKVAINKNTFATHKMRYTFTNKMTF